MSFNVSASVVKVCDSITLNISKQELGPRILNSMVKQIDSGVIIGRGVASRLASQMLTLHDMPQVRVQTRWVQWERLPVIESTEFFAQMDNVLSYFMITRPEQKDTYYEQRTNEYIERLRQAVASKEFSFTSWIPNSRFDKAVKAINLRAPDPDGRRKALAEMIANQEGDIIQIHITKKQTWGSI